MYPLVIPPPPEVLITLVLLVSWLQPFEEMGMQPQYDVLDFFAGAGRCAKAARVAGMEAAAFDISYHAKSKVFDINSPAGFVFLSSIAF